MLGFLTSHPPWSGKWRSPFQHNKPVRQIRPEAGQDASPLGARSVTTLSAAELQEAASLLACSFDDSPLFRLAFPGSDSRRRILRALFITILKDAICFGRIEMAYSHQIVGVLIWYPPGGYPMSILRILRLLPEYLCIVAANPLGILKLFRAQIVLDRYRPKQPHCHGYFLCARPGKLVGGLLIRHMLNQLDKLQLPIYLETQESRCLNLYGRFGFKLTQNGFKTLARGPITWTMWRDPRPIRPSSNVPAAHREHCAPPPSIA